MDDEMFKDVEMNYMLAKEAVVSKFECVEDTVVVNNELLQLEADIFDKHSVVTAETSSNFSDYSKTSSSNNGSYPGSRTKLVSDPDNRKFILRKRRRTSSDKLSKSGSSRSRSVPKKIVCKINDQNEDRCDYCGKKGFLVCCDFCEASFHQKCHTPPIETIPDGEFQCYKCYNKKFYEENPLPCLSSSTIQSNLRAAYFIKELQTTHIMPFKLPDRIKALVKEVPAMMPYDDFPRKFKRKKTDYLSNCYVCDKPVTVRNSNQCQFCPNTIHLDCNPNPECATRLYVWRCAMHVENYLDTYFLDSSSTCRRLQLWSKYTADNLDKSKVEAEFERVATQRSSSSEALEVAKILVDLKYSVQQREKRQDCLINFSEAERRLLLLNKSMLYSDVFTNNSKAIAAFFPAFKTSISPLVYEGRPLSIGTNSACTFNLRTLGLSCANMCDRQLTLQQKQGVHYLCCGNSSAGFTRVGDVLLMERASGFQDRCRCARSDEVDIQNVLICSRVAVFPHKLYVVQLGCAFFYLVFRPTMITHQQQLALL